MPELTIDEFKRIDLRVATVLEAERVAGTDKLLRLKVRLGDVERQLVAGIGKSYKPEDLPGMQIVVVANLKPAKIRGVESRGMLLAAVGDHGEVLLGPESEVQDGLRVQ